MLPIGCLRSIIKIVRYVNCGKIVQPLFELDGGFDCHICPECGCTIDACTDNIQVIGRDM